MSKADDFNNETLKASVRWIAAALERRSAGDEIQPARARSEPWPYRNARGAMKFKSAEPAEDVVNRIRDEWDSPSLTDLD